ncbi:MAG: carbonic anhydrase family protein, partial [Gammaproteobacteria bacterium]
HEINGKKYAMEAHLVNQDKDGHIVAIAVLFNIGTRNSFLADVYQIVKNKSNQGMLKLSPSELLPANTTFYSYKGSLTTPPCAPVTWIVMQNPLTVTQHQIDVFKERVIEMNARPIQERDDRPVMLSH